MNTKDIFDAFSDEDEPVTTKRAAPEMEGIDAPLEKRSLVNLERRAMEQQAVVTDDFGQNVEKEYHMEKGTITSDQPGKEQVVVMHQVRHQVALPPDYPYVPLSKHVPPEVPARTYPFVLDPFQKTAIASIERNESVLVAAHTSAGKTVVAEYAIAQSLKQKQRVIYTSPIKALSNQKYRELLAEFGDVGLMTGDVVINPEASCLVMTTEILRSMLYRGSEVMREVAWVVFDEVHYMRDKERGVVWEETLIMLADKIHFLFLSATIPNAMQFAEWICKLHKQPCHVVFTDFRPTPLQHYLFPAGGQGIYLAVDEKGTFREDNFQKAITVIGGNEEVPGEKKKKPGRGHQKSSATDMFKVIHMIMKKNYHPVIVFSFSKRMCESSALALSKLDFTDSNEKDMVKKVYNNAIMSLSEDDRALPQIEHLLPLLQRGIGIHHSGLLPILKEVIEILFQEGLLKVLFATETFSIGLNMPAKTVLFTSVRKYDGKSERWLGGGEYIQMSGRAGRRGLDERGVVILMVDEKMEPAVAKSMLKGISDPLNSAFHLTYNMILNLLRVDGLSPEFILESSFFQFQNCAKIPQLSKDILTLEKRRAAIEIEHEDAVATYYQMRTQLEIYKQDVRDVLNHPTYCLPFLQPGRLIRMRKKSKNEGPDDDFGWGIIINFRKTFQKSKSGNLSAVKDGPVYVLDALLRCEEGTEAKRLEVKPSKDENGELVAVPCSLDAIDGLSSVRVYVPNEVKSVDSRAQLLKTLKEVMKRFPKGIPLLDPVKDMGIKDDSFVKLMEKMAILEKRLQGLEISRNPQLEDLYEKYVSKTNIGSKIKELKKEIFQAEAVLQLDELKCRKRVLRRLGYINEADVIELKGRVACELSSGDELVIAELIFNGFFNELTAEQSVALLSCFVCDEKIDEKKQKTMKDELDKPFKGIIEVAKQIYRVSIESKLEVDETEYIRSFNPLLVEVVYAWAQGSKFSQICKMTDMFEGSIIRIMKRLYELMQELVTVAKNIGNTELQAKFEEGATKLKRDIVFAASLYL